MANELLSRLSLCASGRAVVLGNGSVAVVAGGETMITFLTIVLVACFVLVCIPIRKLNPDEPAVSLNKLGYRLTSSYPDANGLCKFKLIDSHDQVIAETDEPGTVEDAFSMARRFVAQMEEE